MGSCGMRSGVLVHSFTVRAAPDVVYAHLADPASYVGLSPLVVEVRDIRPAYDAEGRSTVGYVAVERFRWARFVRWDNPIRVVLTQARPGSQLVSDVTSPARVSLRATVDLRPDPAGTRVTETVDVRAPAPLRGFVLRQARAVQLRRAQELTRRMAGPV
jgi:carbon monoxide dehydrogenase subunit G